MHFMSMDMDETFSVFRLNQFLQKVSKTEILLFSFFCFLKFLYYITESVCCLENQFVVFSIQSSQFQFFFIFEKKKKSQLHPWKCHAKYHFIKRYQGIIFVFGHVWDFIRIMISLFKIQKWIEIRKVFFLYMYVQSSVKCS